MKRRTLLAVGVGTGVMLALGGALVGSVRSGLNDGRLSVAGREVFAAVARVVLADLLPADAAARAAAIDAHLDRVDATIAGLSPPLQSEIAELVTLLATPPGRLALTGLTSDWADAGDAELQRTMQNLRTSSLQVRQQVFHALRNLTNGAWFADPSTWAAIGYPGQRPV